MVYSAYGIVLLVKFWQNGEEYLVARFSSFMHSRRIDDRIRSLSARIAEASNHELEPILQELLDAIHQKLERLRGLAANRFLGGVHPKERRALPP